MTIPVYFINGFLESGKTEFINYTIEEDYFKIDELTLIIACEDGEVEYDPEALYNGNAVLERLDAETDFTIKNLTALAKKHDPERIIIEYNGMWTIDHMVEALEGTPLMIFQTIVSANIAASLGKNR